MDSLNILSIYFKSYFYLFKKFNLKRPSFFKLNNLVNWDKRQKKEDK